MADESVNTELLQPASEDWFLAELERPQINATAMLASFEAMRTSGQAEQAESRAELLQDTLIQKGQTDDAFSVLEWRASRAEGGSDSGMTWKQEALDLAGASWEQKNLVEQSGFDQKLPARECIRRLRLLRAMHPGVLCYDKTWGLGVVASVDYFYQRIEINFERKLGHQLSMAYAAEALALIGENHLLLWKHRRLDELKKLIVDSPAEVVRMAMKSFGPMSLIQLQQYLVPTIMSEPEWKKFWEQARKDLKHDPSIDIPTGRAGVLRFRETGSSQEDELFAALAAERDLIKIVSTVESLAGRKAPAFTDAQRNIVLERIRFVAKGVTLKQRGILARARTAAEALGMDWHQDAEQAPSDELFEKNHFIETLRQLPVKSIRSYLRHMATIGEERTRILLVSLLPEFEISSFNEAMTYLLETGAEASCAKVFKTAADNRKFNVEMLQWLVRNLDRVDTWSLGAWFTLMMGIVDVLESEYNGERLKAQNQLRERVSKSDWISDILKRLDDYQRRQFLVRVKDSNGWDTLDRQSFMARIIKMYPELQDVVASAKVAKTASADRALTSARSFKERQVQLEKIVNVEIPKVARDIGVARSYGDLRENFEFKAAKEAQTILFRRRDELTEMLHRVSPTNFQDFPFDRAGMGTSVLLNYPDGKQERYYILGEWDGDTALGIISNTSRMAIALEGRKQGERITVPSESGDVTCEVTEVAGLPQQIRDWVEGR